MRWRKRGFATCLVFFTSDVYFRTFATVVVMWLALKIDREDRRAFSFSCYIRIIVCVCVGLRLLLWTSLSIILCPCSLLCLLAHPAPTEFHYSLAINCFCLSSSFRPSAFSRCSASRRVFSFADGDVAPPRHVTRKWRHMARWRCRSAATENWRRFTHSRNNGTITDSFVLRHISFFP